MTTGAKTLNAHSKLPFESLYRHGFVRVAVCLPHVKVAHPTFNTARTVALANEASELGAAIALFPELGLSAYSNEDLFHQDALLEAALGALTAVIDASRHLTPLLVVGLPLRFEDCLFNCAVAIYRGVILGVVPKTYLPNYREFYEKRQFTSGQAAVADVVTLFGQTVPFGAGIVFRARDWHELAVHVELCEDVWAPIPPSTYAALAGATVLCNLSASNITVGKAGYRKMLCASQSGRCIAAYLYAAAGPGESTTDLAWDGHALIYENSELLAEAERFSREEQVVLADVDLERLTQDRMRMTSFNDCAALYRDELRRLRFVDFAFEPPQTELRLQRRIERFPYVPSGLAERDARCYEVYNIQVQGLVKRLEATGIQKVVLGVSGGLDSTQALIVAAKSMDQLGLPRQNVLGYALPGFATSEFTHGNALALMRALGVTAGEIDLRPSCNQMLRDIHHPASEGRPEYDVVYENVQAGERTSHLFRLANLHQALVVGTSDLSELALGWTTYGVGDHMSHYAVNASVPKTLIQYLIRWVIATRQFDDTTSAVLAAIVETTISPELVPSLEGQGGTPAQRTENEIGPYELQDFNLYYVSRYGYRPSKVAFLSHQAWGDPNRGAWPEYVPFDKRHGYDLETIGKWLEVFLFRFFQLSQFKRSCLPNGPKVGSGGSLSPRSDWRAPSDAEAQVWLDELRRSVPVRSSSARDAPDAPQGK